MTDYREKWTSEKIKNRIARLRYSLRPEIRDANRLAKQLEIRRRNIRRWQKEIEKCQAELDKRSKAHKSILSGFEESPKADPDRPMKNAQEPTSCE